jgi:hypothetical protein
MLRDAEMPDFAAWLKLSVLPDPGNTDAAAWSGLPRVLKLAHGF